ncbi:hypothetical protein RND81_02G157400 [Saponaria officinalis]|uniref:Calcium uniporter protein C-terminal domain-containing protein n=1 Tax=Saponaria officinalis TaxID=3572 RepID=A0AAW1MR07_SAPOF
MTLKKALVQRLFNLSRFSTTIRPNPTQKPTPPLIDSDQSTAAMRLFPPKTNTLTEALGRLNLDGVVAHQKQTVVSEVKKVEMISEKLKSVGKEWVKYEEYDFVKMQDDFGFVIVFGNYVCLRPQQVAKALQNLVTPPESVDFIDPRRVELELMEEQKAKIDQKAEALVRRELWAGLGYTLVQTAAFMRLTFWELSWDVMEPVCFYVTSIYFLLGYIFFLRTTKEPSFEEFFQRRFNAKLKRLMKTQEFNFERYIKLRKVLYPYDSSSLPLDDVKFTKFDHYNKIS